MGYAEELKAAEESISDEEMERLIEELSDYHKRTEIVTLAIPSEMVTPAIYRAFANFADEVLANIPGAFLNGTTIYIPQSPEAMRRHVINNRYYELKRKAEETA